MITMFDFLIEDMDIFDLPAAIYPSGDGFDTTDVGNNNEEQNKDKLLTRNFATGKWEGVRPAPHWYDFILNKIDPSTRGDLYQSSDNPEEKYVKFTDGTKFKYDLYNSNNPDTKALMAKVYHKDNTTPKVDPLDVALGFGSDVIFAKPIQHIGMGMMKRPMNFAERSVFGSAGLTPISSMKQHQ